MLSGICLEQKINLIKYLYMMQEYIKNPFKRLDGNMAIDWDL